MCVEASFSWEEGTSSSGSILKDDKGVFLPARNRGTTFVSNPTTAEPPFLHEGLLAAWVLRCKTSEVNFDRGNQHHEGRVQLAGCTHLCHFLTRVCFEHFPREHSFGADIIARHVLVRKTLGMRTCLISFSLGMRTHLISFPLYRNRCICVRQFNIIRHEGFTLKNYSFLTICSPWAASKCNFFD